MQLCCPALVQEIVRMQSSSSRPTAAIGALLVLIVAAGGLGACAGKSGAVYSRADGGSATGSGGTGAGGGGGAVTPEPDGSVPDAPMTPAAPSCSDNVKNQDETDIDCGGACPTRCANGRLCAAPADCMGGVCTKDICQTAGCANMAVDGQESDVDCGGLQCGPCDVGKHCQSLTDCQSGICTAMTCEMPSCTDHRS